MRLFLSRIILLLPLVVRFAPPGPERTPWLARSSENTWQYPGCCQANAPAAPPILPVFGDLEQALGRIRVQEDIPGIEIVEPGGGAAVQGTLSIVGSADPEDFFFYELGFRYAGGPEDPWFVIAESFTPVSEGTLGEWDTFAITDGDYDLRLLVTLTDATQIEHRVTGVRVRNYTVVETGTPGPAATPTATHTPDLTAQFTPSATATVTPTPTAAPTFTPPVPNPAEIDSGEISTSLARGAAGVLALFILIGLYSSIRSIRRK